MVNKKARKETIKFFNVLRGNRINLRSLFTQTNLSIKMNKEVVILAIESSCDDTSVAISKNDKILANLTASQKIHEKYGGVVPELASRDHQKNIVPVCMEAIDVSGIKREEISAIAFTEGPGLMGSLLVGNSFAKSLAQSWSLPLIGVHHMQAHILAHFIKSEKNQVVPDFPFVCLTVSGGHTQLVLLRDHFTYELLGETKDDAAGEAFDKAAKLLGLPYPGGPVLDQLARSGNSMAFQFAKSKMPAMDFSFSGIKTSLLYFLNEKTKTDPDFISNNLKDLCASYQRLVIEVLLEKLELSVKESGVKSVALAGGVSANSELRTKTLTLAEKLNCKCFIPPLEYCTDNAAMIAISAYFKFLEGQFSPLNTVPRARWEI